MALAPLTSILDAVDEGQAFTQTITYTNEDAPADPPVEPPPEPGPLPVIESVTSSINDSTIVIEFVENTLTISGTYNNAFPGKTFEYIPKGQPGTTVSVPYNQIPAQIDSLVKYNPVGITSAIVIYTITTDVGTATVTQEVKNNWDAGKGQMLAALSRGVY